MQHNGKPRKPNLGADARRRVRVAQVLDARYQPGNRPILWNERRPGLERVRTTTGEEIVLSSSGGQSTPAPGWELLLTPRSAEGDASGQPVYNWTLYGISPEAISPAT